jgi:hypothetical protein
MRLPRARFTVRRMMAVVAVASLILGAIRDAHQIRHRRLAKARMYDQKLGPLFYKSMFPGQLSAEEERLSSLYLRLAGELRYRSGRPWLPEPSSDPPKDLGKPAEEFQRYRRAERNQ